MSVGALAGHKRELPLNVISQS